MVHVDAWNIFIFNGIAKHVTYLEIVDKPSEVLCMKNTNIWKRFQAENAHINKGFVTGKMISKPEKNPQDDEDDEENETETECKI